MYYYSVTFILSFCNLFYKSNFHFSRDYPLLPIHSNRNPQIPSVILKKKRQPSGCLFAENRLLLDDFQNFHGAGLGTDAAGDALGSGTLIGHNHDLHGAGLDTLAAADTLLLVDHVNAGLGILSDGLMLTGTHALTALNADIGLCSTVLINNLDAGQSHIVYLIESLRTGLDALQASHALCAFYNSELLHKRTLLY
jgi:hypothetical protein